MAPVNSFLSEGLAHSMSSYVLVCTGPVNQNAITKLRGVKCNILTKEHLRNSSINWSQYPRITTKEPKKLRDYQTQAKKDVINGFRESVRGKMVMACGTGKTLVSMRIAEDMVGKGGNVLYLVPSISLILQSMREWSDNSTIPHYYMAVCSDKSVRNEDQGTLTELEVPASTSHEELKEKMARRPSGTLNVIFSTYHSIEVVMIAMKGKSFDLILCDEAHRTTGISNMTNESYLTILSNINSPTIPPLHVLDDIQIEPGSSVMFGNPVLQTIQ